MLQVVVLVFLFGTIEIPEGLHTDVDGLAGLCCQSIDAPLGDSSFLIGQIVDRQGIGMAPVDELTTPVKGINAGQENVEEGLEADLPGIVVDADGGTWYAL